MIMSEVKVSMGFDTTGQVKAELEWTPSNDAKIQEETGKNLAAIILYSYTAEVLPYLYSELGKKTDNIAKWALHYLQVTTAAQRKAPQVAAADSDEPIIGPNMVFRVRG